jgi:hypothetical protein
VSAMSTSKPNLDLNKNVILSEAPRRSIAQQGVLARSRRTSRMLVGRCSPQLSGHQNLKEIKKSQPPTGAQRRDLLFSFLLPHALSDTTKVSDRNQQATATVAGAVSWAPAAVAEADPAALAESAGAAAAAPASRAFAPCAAIAAAVRVRKPPAQPLQAPNRE